MKTEVVGLGENEVNETTILGRILRVTEDGWEYEGDPRHGEILIKEMNMKEAKWGRVARGGGKEA